MKFNRAVRNPECVADFLVGRSVHQECEDLLFPYRELTSIEAPACSHQMLGENSATEP